MVGFSVNPAQRERVLGAVDANTERDDPSNSVCWTRGKPQPL
jgi:hypothetical protein